MRGTAHVLCVEESDGARSSALFDRSADHGALIGEISAARTALSSDNVLDQDDSFCRKGAGFRIRRRAAATRLIARLPSTWP
jgi:hypothetical protein